MLVFAKGVVSRTRIVGRFPILYCVSIETKATRACPYDLLHLVLTVKQPEFLSKAIQCSLNPCMMSRVDFANNAIN